MFHRTSVNNKIVPASPKRQRKRNRQPIIIDTESEVTSIRLYQINIMKCIVFIQHRQVVMTPDKRHRGFVSPDGMNMEVLC